MKKILLFGIAFSGILIQGMAQGSWGTNIGKTTYDLQSNTASPNRISIANNGNISATWTMSKQFNETWSDRGTGYAYFNGSTWSSPPTDPLEKFAAPTPNVRTGWPEIMNLENGSEYISNHSGTNVSSLRRSTQGSGTWSGLYSLTGSSNGTWPRLATSGTNLHVVFSANDSTVIHNGVEILSPMWYKRSTDNGVTWNTNKILFNGLENLSFVGGDRYAIDAHNNVVAITAGYSNEPWMLFKSTDNGDTWNAVKIMEWNVDGRIVANGQDAYGVLSPTSDHTVLVDNSGKIHAWTAGYASGTGSIADDSACFGGDSYYPGVVDFMLYWNESMTEPMVIMGLQPDIDGDGEIRVADISYYDARAVYGLSNIHSPISTVDADGNLYVTYFAPVEGVDDGTGNYFYPTQSGDESGRSYTDLYTTISKDGGYTWSKPIFLAELADPNVVDETKGTGFEEECFPSAIKRMHTDNKYHLIWQTDFETSLNLRTHHAVVENFIMYHGFDRDDLLNAATAVGLTDAYTISDSTSIGMGAYDCSLVGVSNPETIKKSEIKEATKVYPNPTTGLINLSLKLNNNSKTTVVIRNMFGQEVMATPSVQLNKGHNTLQVNLSELANGIYTFTLITEEGTSTGRIVKE